MASRYYHTMPFVRKKKTNYSKLLNAEDRAKMQYNINMAFRSFVNEWRASLPELRDWSLSELYKAYQSQGIQLKLDLA